MKKFLLLIGIAVATTFAANEASAQIKAGEGQVSIAFETNNIYYAKDKTLSKLGLMDRPELPFGSHDYLKVDYSLVIII